VTWELTMGALAFMWVAIGFLIDEIESGLRPDLEAAGAGPKLPCSSSSSSDAAQLNGGRLGCDVYGYVLGAIRSE